MNKKIVRLLAVATLLCPFVGAAEDIASKQTEENKDGVQPEGVQPSQPQKERTKEELLAPEYMKKMSLMYGYFIEKSLENPVVKFDVDEVIRGIKDAQAGGPAPMSEQEYEESMALIQEYAFHDLAAKNLKEADKFLVENAKKEGVKEIEPGKLQYIQLKEGHGKEVTEGSIPVIVYTGKYLNGTVFGSSETSGGPLSISLKQTIPGFRKGVLGMREGEERRIFIHPDLGYGTSGQLMPNALLIFDIKVKEVKPETPPQVKGEPKSTDTKMAQGQKAGGQEEEGEDEESDDDEDNGADETPQEIAAAESLFPDELDVGEPSDDDDDSSPLDTTEDDMQFADDDESSDDMGDADDDSGETDDDDMLADQQDSASDDDFDSTDSDDADESPKTDNTQGK